MPLHNEAIFWIHSFLLAAYLLYFFKFSERKKDFFEHIYASILTRKSSITGEIAKEFSKLLKPIPDVYILRDRDIEYKDGVKNPAESESFKGWLDNYLEKNNTFLRQYSEMKSIYQKWKGYSDFLKYLALVLAIIEFIIICLKVVFINVEEFAFVNPMLSAILFVLGMLLVLRTLRLENRLRDMEEENAGL